MMSGFTSDNPHLSEPKSKASDEREIDFKLLELVDLDSAAGEIDFSPDVASYIRASISENTLRAYRADIDHFIGWGSAIPCTPETLATYLVAHAGVFSVSTLKRRVAAISAAHEAKDLPNPTHSKTVKAALRGLNRLHGAPQKETSPLLIEDLVRIVGTMGDSVKEVRDKALLLIGFAGGFRRSELVSLEIDDLDHVRQGLVVTIRRSKTDQVGDGRKIGIPFARGRHCPEKSVEAWLKLIGVSEGPVFRPVSKNGTIGRSKLSGEAVAIIVKEHANRIGLDPSTYSGHSLRAGLATSSAMHGVSSISIRRQTGHRSDAMLQRYIRNGELFVSNAAGSLL
jgi:integrase